MMKLLEFLNLHSDVTEDTSDTIYDAVVTVVWDKECNELAKTDWYYTFCKELYAKVDFVEVNKYNVWIVDYAGFIKRNLEHFKKYSEQNWKSSYHNLCDEDEDEYIYTWINNIHYLLSGEITESESKDMIDMLSKCK